MTETFHVIEIRSFSAYADLCGEPQEPWMQVDGKSFDTKFQAIEAAKAYEAEGYQTRIVSYDVEDVYDPVEDFNYVGSRHHY